MVRALASRGNSTQAIFQGAALGSESCPPANITWLLIILAATHFLLQTAAHEKLATSPNCFLDRFTIPDNDFNHVVFSRLGERYQVGNRTF